MPILSYQSDKEIYSSDWVSWLDQKVDSAAAASSVGSGIDISLNSRRVSPYAHHSDLVREVNRDQN